MNFHLQFPKLETERFELRQFSQNDLENVFQGLSHPEVIKFYGVSFDSIEATQEQMDWFKALEEEGKGIWWAICNKASGRFNGAGGFCDWDHDLRKAEVGFWLLPEYWGVGIMKEVMPLICQFAFDEMKLQSIEGYVESDNQNCKRGLAKLDFKLVETLKKSEIKNGKAIDIDVYIMTNKAQ